MFIATLIAADRLTTAEISQIVDALHPLARVDGWCWLEDGVAADIRFADDVDWAQGVLDGWRDRADIIVQPAEDREKQLLVADMDSTMITVECIDELADYAGLKAEIAEVTERAMRGELDFAAALDARVALLKGLDEDAIDRCLAERVTMSPGAETLVKTMAARGATTVLISGGFTRFAEPVGARLGFSRVIANRLLIADGALTGAVAKPIVDAATKEATLAQVAAELGLPPVATMAIGDGANDLPMIRRAGLGVAYRAKPIVAAAAAARIEHNGLSALLHAQGISRAEWVSA